ncbi:fasciclin domain-containing protein [Phormidesmis priestleyi]
MGRYRTAINAPFISRQTEDRYGREASRLKAKGVKINNSTVTTPDVAADNGVIHIIDSVLMPA